MSDFDINFPWIKYGVQDKTNKIKEKMDELKSAPWSPFNGCDYAEIFIFCMSYGFAKKREPIQPPDSQGSMPPSAFKRDMRDFMKAVAISSTNDLDVITKPNEVAKICEGYAYASFQEVYDKIKEDTSSSPEMILDLMLQEIETSRK